MSDFGRGRGLTLVPLPAARAGRPLGLPTNDAAIVDALEAELEQARTALSALEEASAVARLTRVESQLLAHPHLPQAAFLMGECLALQARAAREQSPARALALEARRSAIEGPRAAAFGETAAAAPTLAPLELVIRGLAREDELELDATNRGAARRAQLQPGIHHARVWRRDRLIFATFFEVAPEQTSLELAAPSIDACGYEDLAEASSASSPHGIACPRWAKVRDEARGIGVALCEHERCGAFLHWERRKEPAFAPIAVDRGGGLPRWATFTIAGTATLVATGLVLWQAGAFERGRPSAASWEYGGLNPQAIRF